MSLLKNIEYEAAVRTKKVYDKYLNVLFFESTSKVQAHQFLLFNILYEKKYPLRTYHFRYIATRLSEINPEFLKMIFVHKIEFDKYVSKCIALLANIVNVNLLELDSVLRDKDLYISTFYTLYLYDLLSNNYVNSYEDIDFDAKVCISNISKHYKNINFCIDISICESAYFANSFLLKTVIQVLESLNLSFKFLPKTNETHRRVLNWVKENLERYEKDEKAILGWLDGPCCSPWPSEKISDYECTYFLLKKLM